DLAAVVALALSRLVDGHAFAAAGRPSERSTTGRVVPGRNRREETITRAPCRVAPIQRSRFDDGSQVIAIILEPRERRRQRLGADLQILAKHRVMMIENVEHTSRGSKKARRALDAFDDLDETHQGLRPL